MTEEDKSHLAILLPTATVALFSRDQETVEAFQSLESDWRFARVALEVHDGDVETATAKYRSSQTPELLIVQTEDIDSGFTDKLVPRRHRQLLLVLIMTLIFTASLWGWALVII